MQRHSINSSCSPSFNKVEVGFVRLLQISVGLPSWSRCPSIFRLRCKSGRMFGTSSKTLRTGRAWSSVPAGSTSSKTGLPAMLSNTTMSLLMKWTMQASPCGPTLPRLMRHHHLVLAATNATWFLIRPMHEVLMHIKYMAQCQQKGRTFSPPFAQVVWKITIQLGGFSSTWSTDRMDVGTGFMEPDNLVSRAQLCYLDTCSMSSGFQLSDGTMALSVPPAFSGNAFSFDSASQRFAKLDKRTMPGGSPNEIQTLCNARAMHSLLDCFSGATMLNQQTLSSRTSCLPRFFNWEFLIFWEVASSFIGLRLIFMMNGRATLNQTSLTSWRRRTCRCSKTSQHGSDAVRWNSSLTYGCTFLQMNLTYRLDCPLWCRSHAAVFMKCRCLTIWWAVLNRSGSSGNFLQLHDHEYRPDEDRTILCTCLLRTPKTHGLPCSGRGAVATVSASAHSSSVHRHGSGLYAQRARPEALGIPDQPSSRRTHIGPLARPALRNLDSGAAPAVGRLRRTCTSRTAPSSLYPRAMGPGVAIVQRAWADLCWQCPAPQRNPAGLPGHDQWGSDIFRAPSDAISGWDLQHMALGAPMSKPTTFLYSNSNLSRALEVCADASATRPTAHLIGRNSDGTFKTAKAKEYPAQLNRAFAQAIFEAMTRWSMAPGDADAESFGVELARTSASTECGQMFPDYQPCG